MRAGANGRVTVAAIVPGRAYAEIMYTIELNDEELRLLRSAIGSYLHAFGHDEADVLRAAKQLLAKCPEPAAPASVGSGGG